MSCFRNLLTGEIKHIKEWMKDMMNYPSTNTKKFELLYDFESECLIFVAKDSDSGNIEPLLKLKEVVETCSCKPFYDNAATSRKYLPSIADLIDRLSIDLLKVVFIADKEEIYQKEIQDIMHDIDLFVSNKDIKITSSLLKYLIILSQINVHIWYNERDARSGKDQDLNKLKLTHSLNGIRNLMKNKILEEIKEEKGYDYKVDCLAAEFKEWNSLCK